MCYLQNTPRTKVIFSEIFIAFLIQTNNQKMSKKIIEFYEGTPQVFAEFYTLDDGTKHGEYKEYYENGKLFQRVNYVNGMVDGICEDYSIQGHLFTRSNFKNGKIHGQTQKFYPDGKVNMSTMFNEGTFHGLSTFYDSCGNKTHEFFHENNNELWQKDYYPNGQIKKERIHKRFALDKLRAWKEDGTEIKFPRLMSC